MPVCVGDATNDVLSVGAVVGVYDGYQYEVAVELSIALV
jgi:hypothetical protein